MGKDLVRVVQCLSDVRSGRRMTPLTSKVQGHANPTGTRSRGFHWANHEFFRNLTLPFAWFGTCCQYRRVSGAIVAGLESRNSIVFHVQQTPRISFPEEEWSEGRSPYLLVSPVLTQDIRRVHVTREELEVNGSRCNTLTRVVVREGMVAFPQR